MYWETAVAYWMRKMYKILLKVPQYSCKDDLRSALSTLHWTYSSRFFSPTILLLAFSYDLFSVLKLLLMLSKNSQANVTSFGPFMLVVSRDFTNVCQLCICTYLKACFFNNEHISIQLWWTNELNKVIHEIKQYTKAYFYYSYRIQLCTNWVNKYKITLFFSLSL